MLWLTKWCTIGFAMSNENNSNELKFMMAAAAERKKEFKKLKKSKTVKKQSPHIESHLKERALRSIHQEDFEKERSKAGGLSGGYFAKDHIVKESTKQKLRDKDLWDLTTEYSFSKIYELFLADRTPKIGLNVYGSELDKAKEVVLYKTKNSDGYDVTKKATIYKGKFGRKYFDFVDAEGNKTKVRVTKRKLAKYNAERRYKEKSARSPIQEDNKARYIALRSKLFRDEFQTISEFSGALQGAGFNGSINPQNRNLREIEGFEKVVAACIFCGEIDYHASNLGVVHRDNKYLAVKIDHGKSGEVFLDGAKKLIEYHHDRMNNHYGYEHIPFSLTKFASSLRQMCYVTDDSISQRIDSAEHELSHIGVPEEVVTNFASQNKNNLIIQKRQMQEIVLRSEIILELKPEATLSDVSKDLGEIAKESNKTIDPQKLKSAINFAISHPSKKEFFSEIMKMVDQAKDKSKYQIEHEGKKYQPAEYVKMKIDQLDKDKKSSKHEEMLLVCAVNSNQLKSKVEGIRNSIISSMDGRDKSSISTQNPGSRTKKPLSKSGSQKL